MAKSAISKPNRVITIDQEGNITVITKVDLLSSVSQSRQDLFHFLQLLILGKKFLILLRNFSIFKFISLCSTTVCNENHKEKRKPHPAFNTLV